MAARPILVAVAWPYANGPLHLGHVAGSLLPPDIFARYHRMAGSKVLMVSGSDMHGTPITVKAEEEGVAPEVLARRYHEQHKRDLAALGVEFGGPGHGDFGPSGLFTSTATRNHAQVVHDVFRALLAKGHVAKRRMRAPFDPQAKRFLPDRYVEGTCPRCGAPDARGDQCDACGRTLDPQELREPRSKLTGAKPEWRETEHFFLLLSRFEERLKAWSEAQAARAGWRANTINFTRNWLREGLKDRAITRDLGYGVRLPPEVERSDPAFREKRIYVWFEAVIGYLSAAKEWAQRSGDPEAWRAWWLDPEARHHYFLGKDNIPFHTIVWPAILLGYAEGKGEPYQLPWDVPANEFMNFGGAKFSKSRGNVILVQEVTPRFEGDAVRYYLTANLPDTRDADFLWEEFVRKVNEELVATLGNFLHRTLTFAHRHWGAVPEPGGAEAGAEARHLAGIREDLARVASSLEACWFKEALKALMAMASKGNQMFQEARPWDTVKEDPARCARDLHQLLRVAKTLALAMAPFLPRAAQELWEQLGEAGSVHGQAWPRDLATLTPGQRLREPRVLFKKIEPESVRDLVGEPMPEPNEAPEPKPEAAPARAPPGGAAKPQVSLAEFQRVDLRVGAVREVKPHPQAEKLYVLRVDLGSLGERQLVAGLRPHVKPEELQGKRVVVVANLEPARLRGVESQGMLLAAELGGRVVPLTTAGDIGPGARVL